MFASRPSAPLGLSVAVAMLAGVVAAQCLPRLPPMWLAASATLGGLAMWIIGRRGRLVGAWLVGLAWSAVIAAWQLTAVAAIADSGDQQVVGRVVDLPRVAAHATRFDFQVDPASRSPLAGHKLRLAWYGRAPSLAPGSRWQLDVRLRPPPPLRNPGSYDPARQALAEGRVAQGYVKPTSSRRPLAGGEGVDAWRARTARTIAAAVPDRRARFLRALAIGDTRDLDDDDWFVLRATGLTHQIAISGFHVGMVAAFGALLVRLAYLLAPTLARLCPRPQAAALGAIALAGYYAAVAGFSLPTVRTLLMIAVALGARMLRRRLALVDALALALIAILSASPLAVLAPGFWLSFVGVGWLVWCLPGDAGEGHVRPFLKAQGVAVVGLLPLTICFFSQASTLAPVANLVGIPVISLGVVPLSLLGLALQPASPFLAEGCWHGAAVLMQLLWSALVWSTRLRAALCWFPEVDAVDLALALAGAFWLLLPRGIPGKSLALCLMLPLLWPRLDLPPAASVDLLVLDVGKGNAVLVRTAHHALLVDAGPPAGGDGGSTATLEALQALGVHALDAVVVSHGDSGRSGGLPVIRRWFPAAQVVAPAGWAGPGQTWCRAGAHWRWDDVRFDLLHPPANFPNLPGDNSCVLRIEAGGRVALLPGDIGTAVQQHLASSHPLQLRADWLLAPRHARRGSVDDHFIADVSPAWVVVSTERPGRRGAAEAATLARLGATRAQVLTTAEQGAMRFRLDASGVTRVAPGRSAGARYWRAWR